MIKEKWRQLPKTLWLNLCPSETLNLQYFHYSHQFGLQVDGQCLALTHTQTSGSDSVDLDLMPFWHRWLFSALSIEMHSSLG